MIYFSASVTNGTACLGSMVSVDNMAICPRTGDMASAHKGIPIFATSVNIINDGGGSGLHARGHRNRVPTLVKPCDLD